jgi:hypothetical protein
MQRLITVHKVMHPATEIMRVWLVKNRLMMQIGNQGAFCPIFT